MVSAFFSVLVIRNQILSRVGSQLIINSMSLADVGEYTCTASNLLGQTEVKFNVTLFGKSHVCKF